MASKSEGEAHKIKDYLSEFNDELEKVENDELDGPEKRPEVEMEVEEEEAAEGGGDEKGTYFIDEDGQLYFQPSSADADGDGDGPSEGTPPEGDEKKDDKVSYVYIVEEGNDDKQESKEDIAVYDFEEEEDEERNDDAPHEVEKKRGRKPRTTHNCPHCDYSNTKRAALHTHMRIHSDERPYKCSICGKGFRAHSGLANHENTHTGTKPFRCKYCDAKFTTSGEIVRHNKYRHSKVKPHKCNECDYAAVELSKLRRHQRSHTGERPYQCPHCTYASPDTFKLKRHLRVHTGERPYKCDICHAAFTQSNSLKSHRLTHFPENRPTYQCALCPVTCGRKADLRGHISKLHTSNKPFECKRCGKRLPDRYSYKMHTRTHTGEKSFKCPYCMYASISKLHLESHMFIHTNEKPYECDECDYRSRQMQLLKRHKNLYHTPGFVQPERGVPRHECDMCHKTFIHVGNLIKHLALHDPDSNVHQVKEALRAGRKRRVHVKDDDRSYDSMKIVEQVSEDEEEDENEEQCIVYELIDEFDEDGTSKEAPAVEKVKDVQKDMENCFGFSEDEEEEED